VHCVPQYSKLHLRLDSYLKKIGFTIVNTGIVASIDFPPK
jgi:hypothetical protein